LAGSKNHMTFERTSLQLASSLSKLSSFLMGISKEKRTCRRRCYCSSLAFEIIAISAGPGGPASRGTSPLPSLSFFTTPSSRPRAMQQDTIACAHCLQPAKSRCTRCHKSELCVLERRRSLVPLELTVHFLSLSSPLSLSSSLLLQGLPPPRLESPQTPLHHALLRAVRVQQRPPPGAPSHHLSLPKFPPPPSTPHLGSSNPPYLRSPTFSSPLRPPHPPFIHGHHP
jgi:hypothetical protein